LSRKIASRIAKKLKLDERDATIGTDPNWLHRLVRHVAAARRTDDAREHVRRARVEVVAAVYPEEEDVFSNPET
jgi:hypothetical protein